MVVLACCDMELLGKNLVDSRHDVTIDESFYGRQKVTGKELAELLKEADSINLFGKKAVGVALKRGFLRQEDIIRILGIEHAIIMKV